MRLFWLDVCRTSWKFDWSRSEAFCISNNVVIGVAISDRYLEKRKVMMILYFWILTSVIVIFSFPATQFQQSWAYANDVTLLAANANLPVLKTSGSGIYAGRLGALSAYVTETETTKIIIAQVPIDSHLSESQQSHRNKLPIRGNSGSDFRNGVIHPYSSRSNSAFDLLQDDLSRYTVEFLNFTENVSHAGRVCNNGICCNYNVEISEINGEHQKVCFGCMRYNS